MSIKRMSRSVIRNKEELYEEARKKRGLKHIDHYPTANMYHPTADDLADIETISHVWKVGDRYSKLAYHHYGDAELWWIIGWFNQKPTDSHNTIGDVIYIPTPLESVMLILRLKG
jgi:nucleoid-associated protein YgaU